LARTLKSAKIEHFMSEELRSAAHSKWTSIDSEPVPDETPIVRYMKLSSFLMLICGRVFLPNLRKLQEIDAHEGGLPSYLFGKSYGHHLRNLLEPHEVRLRGKAEGLAPPKEPNNSPNYDYFRFLADIWLAELAKRRSVWCWNRYEHESYALWQLYGQRGVCLHSTVGRVKRALEKVGPFRGLVAAISYALPRRLFFIGEDTKPIESMTQPRFLERPYLYKEICYDFEKEVRFVFGINPDLSSEKSNRHGIVIDLDFWQLPDWSFLFATRIEMSRDIPAAEKNAIGTLIQSLDMAKLHKLQDWDKDFEQQEFARGNPFTMSDGPQDLFPDLN
jgi:hypothetical protein